MPLLVYGIGFVICYFLIGFNWWMSLLIALAFPATLGIAMLVIGVPIAGIGALIETIRERRGQRHPQPDSENACGIPEEQPNNEIKNRTGRKDGMSRNKLAAIIVACTIAIIVTIVLVVPDNNGTLDEAQEYFAQGSIYLEQEEWDEAIAAYTKAIELNPESADAYASRAIAYTQKDEYDKAIADCEKAMEINPSITPDPVVASAYSDRGSSYLIEGQFDEAIRDYTKATDIDENDFLAYAFRAMAYKYKDEYSLAIADYSKAIALAPEWVSAVFYSDRGWAYYHIGNYDSAIADFTEVIEVEPENADAYSDRGFVHFTNARENYLSDEYHLAIADFDKALELNPTNADDYIYRGWAYSELSDCDNAIADFTQAIDIAPDADVYNRRGGCYRRTGQYDKAIADYSEAITLDPEYAPAYLNRGSVYALLDRNNEAIADLTKFLALSDDEELNEGIREVIQELES